MSIRNDQIVQQTEIDAVWGRANFGSSYSRMDIVQNGVLKCACGYHQGSTSRQIVTELGLVSPGYRVTKRGKRCLWLWFGDNKAV